MISFLLRGAAFKPYDTTTSLHSSQLEVSISGPVSSDSGVVWCKTSSKSVESYQVCLHKEILSEVKIVVVVVVVVVSLSLSPALFEVFMDRISRHSQS